MRYVSRTIKSVIVITKCVDMNTLEVVDHTFVIGNIPPKNIARTITKLAEENGLRLVKIVDTTQETNKYRMSEADFIAHATVD